MTEKDKKLLLKDLCSRLPYGVMMTNIKSFETHYPLTCDDLYDAMFDNDWDDVPYLRSMSSMTVQEKMEFYDICTTLAADKNHFIMEGCTDSNYMLEKFDWLNKHHFNYRLPDNLFREAPEGMYNN